MSWIVTIEKNTYTQLIRLLRWNLDSFFSGFRRQLTTIYRKVYPLALIGSDSSQHIELVFLLVRKLIHNFSALMTKWRFLMQRFIPRLLKTVFCRQCLNYITSWQVFQCDEAATLKHCQKLSLTAEPRRTPKEEASRRIKSDHEMLSQCHTRL